MSRSNKRELRAGAMNLEPESQAEILTTTGLVDNKWDVKVAVPRLDATKYHPTN